MIDSIPQKPCSKCGKSFPATTEFFHRGIHTYGLHHHCKSCRNHRETPLPVPTPEGYKCCPQCKEVKVLDEFHANKSSRDGHSGWCRICYNAKMRGPLKEQQQEPIQQQKPESHQVQHMHLKMTQRQYYLYRNYGFIEQDFWQMLVTQNNACKLCGFPFTEERKPHIDHCHRTGKVRGILCGPCNRALGQFEDDPALLRRAIDYLEQ